MSTVLNYNILLELNIVKSGIILVTNVISTDIFKVYYKINSNNLTLINFDLIC